MKQLILGGARSGKSRLAEKLAEQISTEHTKNVVYVATAAAGDSEMQQRIEKHQADRPQHWLTIETSISLADTLTVHNKPNNCILVDCLTLWITNCLCSDNPQCFHSELNKLKQCLSTLNCDVIFVSNEVGQGIIPLGELNRRFVDESGLLHQHLAQQCDRTIFTTAGIPQVLKGPALNKIN